MTYEYSKKRIHHKTLPCKTTFLYHIETTENKKEVSCMRCLKEIEKREQQKDIYEITRKRIELGLKP